MVRRLAACGVCLYWSPETKSQGICRRRAPRPSIHPCVRDDGTIREATEAYWPLTHDAGWCGEYIADDQSRESEEAK